MARQSTAAFSDTYHYLTNFLIRPKNGHDFYIDTKNLDCLAEGDKCSLCKGPIPYKYIAMPEWDIKGAMCGKCYSQKIYEHYPGEHVRVSMDKK